MDDEKRIEFMQKALELAELGAGHVAPNPMVGAVIVRDDKIIGQGYHQRCGDAHGEVEAIADCRKRGNDPRGAVMFVTLEPCCHHGKTGPCTEVIAEAGLAEVEIATLDDFGEVCGKGMQWLVDNGIKVNLGCCQKEARRLNAGFFKRVKTNWPLVILKWAQSIDGKLSWSDGAKCRWITNSISRQHVHKLRNRCGAILVGVGTVLVDDPMLTARLDQDGVAQPLRVILDDRLEIGLESQLVQTADENKVVIFTMAKVFESSRDKVKALRDAGCDVLPMPGLARQVNLETVLDDLGKRGVNELLVEGGATVLKSFWQNKLADRVMVYTAPVIIGDGPGVAGINFGNLTDSLSNVQIKQFGCDVLIEGDIEDE